MIKYDNYFFEDHDAGIKQWMQRCPYLLIFVHWQKSGLSLPYFFLFLIQHFLTQHIVNSIHCFSPATIVLYSLLLLAALVWYREEQELLLLCLVMVIIASWIFLCWHDQLPPPIDIMLLLVWCSFMFIRVVNLRVHLRKYLKHWHRCPKWNQILLQDEAIGIFWITKKCQ